MSHGGKRPNSGRKHKKAVPVRRVLAEAILASVDEEAIWIELLGAEDADGNEDWRIRLEALKYLTNRRDGMPPQSIEHKGGDGGPSINVVIRHVGGTIPRV